MLLAEPCPAFCILSCVVQAFHAQYDIAQTLLPKIGSALEEKMSSLDGEHLAIVGKVFGRFDRAAPLFMFWKFTLSAKLSEAARNEIDNDISGDSNFWGYTLGLN